MYNTIMMLSAGAWVIFVKVLIKKKSKFCTDIITPTYKQSHNASLTNNMNNSAYHRIKKKIRFQKFRRKLSRKNENLLNLFSTQNFLR